MNKNLLLFSLLFFLSLLGKPVSATNLTYTSRIPFLASSACIQLNENFDSYENFQELNHLFEGKAIFPATAPRIFWGSWNYAGEAGVFFGAGLLPWPEFEGKSLIITFPVPLFGIGSNVFDDFDGTPYYNQITLKVTTTTGAVFSISETSACIGDAGFLGATSTDGIVSAEFSIDNTDGNLEIDLLTVIVKCICPGTDTDADGICDNVDNCPIKTNTDQADADCDSVGNVCDICPGGNDRQDTDTDGIPDCADWEGINKLPANWRCSNNSKALVCHKGGQICIAANEVPSHLAHGDYLGICNAVACLHFKSTTDNTAPITTCHSGMGLELFPNPAQNEFKLIFEEGAPKNAIMYLQDLSGRILIEEEILPSHEPHNVSVDKIPKGMYVVSVAGIGKPYKPVRLVIN